MKTRAKIIYRLFICGLIGVNAQASTLMDVYESALEYDASLKAARASLDSGRERLPQAKAQLLPQITANWERNQNDLTTTPLKTTTPPGQQAYFSHRTTITLVQPLLSYPKFYQLEQARSLVQEAELTYEQQLGKVMLKSTSAYIESLFALQQLQVAESQAVRLTTQLEAALKLLAAGVGTRTDIDEVQVQLAKNQADVIEARQYVTYARKQLAMIIGREEQARQKLREDALERLTMCQQDLVECTERAMQNNPELKALQQRINAARLEVSKANSGHLPTINGVIGWSDSANDSVYSLNNRYENRSVGVQLNIPIYQGGAVQSVTRQALAELEVQNFTLEDKRRQIALEIFKEFRGVSEGSARLRAQVEALQAAERLLDSTKKSRKAGVRSFLDELNAQKQLDIAQRDVYQARLVSVLAWLRLQILLGRAPDEVVRELALVSE
jgi:outer membrane protein, protease secretion system